MLLDRVLAMKPGSSASPGSSLGYVSNTQWRQSQEGDVHQTPAGTSPRSINHLICALSDDDSRYEAGQTSPRSMDSSHMQVAAAGGVSPGASASSEKRLGGLGTATSIYVKFESYVKVGQSHWLSFPPSSIVIEPTFYMHTEYCHKRGRIPRDIFPLWNDNGGDTKETFN